MQQTCICAAIFACQFEKRAVRHLAAMPGHDVPDVLEWNFARQAIDASACWLDV